MLVIVVDQDGSFESMDSRRMLLFLDNLDQALRGRLLIVIDIPCANDAKIGKSVMAISLVNKEAKQMKVILTDQPSVI